MPRSGCAALKPSTGPACRCRRAVIRSKSPGPVTRRADIGADRRWRRVGAGDFGQARRAPAIPIDGARHPGECRVRLVNSRSRTGPVCRCRRRLPRRGDGSGYESKRLTVQIADGDVTVPVELEKMASATHRLHPCHPPARRRVADRRGADGQFPERHGSLRGPAGVERLCRRAVTRDTLLDGAMRSISLLDHPQFRGASQRCGNGGLARAGEPAGEANL